MFINLAKHIHRRLFKKKKKNKRGKKTTRWAPQGPEASQQVMTVGALYTGQPIVAKLRTT